MNDFVLGPVMMDVSGPTLSEGDLTRIAHPLVGGVILFARNFESKKQLRELVAGIRSVKPNVILAVDQEGGRVQRFSTDGFSRLPPMRALGQLWDADPASGAIRATRLATAVGYVLATELRDCDIDLSFTPVLDLDYRQSQVIGDRAFHGDPRVVTLLAKSLIQGLSAAGMANCGKHFPGHGFVAADSHQARPIDSRPLDVLLATDAAPYDWLGLLLEAVMPAHVTYPSVDSAPAGFSKIWLQRVLRERLGFAGAVLSDDLSMEGAAAADVVTTAQAALAAGCDMVLVCNDFVRAERLLDGLQWRGDPNSAGRRSRLRARSDVRIEGGDLISDPRYRAAKAIVDAFDPARLPQI